MAQRRNRGRLEREERADYGTEYDVAAGYFSSDVTALINASSAALLRQDLDKAWGYLSRIQREPRAANNLGVYYWMRGDHDRARYYFRHAAPEDRMVAERNLRTMEQSLDLH